MTDLIMLLYTSIATHAMSEAELVDILTKSKTHNERDGITGLLLYQNGNFMQVLEGEPHAIEATYERISKDKRHRFITTLIKQRIYERTFGPWRMSFINLSNPEVAEYPGYSSYLMGALGDEGQYHSNSVAMSFIDTFRYLNSLT